MSQESVGPKSAKNDLQRILGILVTANHILHHHDVLDCYGHISVRNPNNPGTFFTARGSAPATVSKAEHFGEFRVEDGAPVDSAERTGLSERYIHSELYKRFPSVHCVVHSHCTDVLPFTVSNVALRPVIHTAGFLGNNVPVWDIAHTYSSGDTHDLLVRTPHLGASLASAFSKSASAAGAIYNTISSKITGSVSEPAAFPDCPVVLMRGHGFALAARGIQDAVYQAIYTQQAAKAQINAVLIEGIHGGGAVEGKVDVEGGGKIKGGKFKPAEGLHYLTAKESADTWATNSERMYKPWAGWEREVERNPLYENELKSRV